MEKKLEGLKVAVLATDGFEESELTEPVNALKNEGALPEVVSIKAGKIQGFKHHDKSIQVPVDRTLDECKPTDFDALMLPGGALNADAIRMVPQVQNFVKAMFEAGKPFAFICHAPWTLVSAGLVKGRKITSYSTIQDDMKNAGADWTDQEVVVDDNWVSSRKPSDLPAFNREMIGIFSKYLGRKTQAA